MSGADFDRQQMFELVWAMRDDALEPKQAQRLDDLVCQNPTAREFYFDAIELLASLRWSVPSDDQPNLQTLFPPPAQMSRKPAILAGLIPAWSSFSIAKAFAFAVSGLLVSYFSLLMFSILWDQAHPATRRVQGSHHEELSSATLVGSVDCRWKGEAPAQPGEPLNRSTLELQSGIVELSFNSGATVTIEGPAVFEVRSPAEGYLGRGKLVAMVPAPAIGFAIETPTTKIVDLGTEFGVEVDADSGATEVHVLRGAVETTRHVKNGTVMSAKPTRVEAGWAIRIVPEANLDEHIAVDEKKFALRSKSSSAAEARVPASVIPLGNLFDDPRRTPLARAVETDTFRATPEIDDVGVERVLHGGDAVKQIAPQVWFDAANLGWEDAPLGEPSNDAWGSFNAQGPLANDLAGGIRTRGTKISATEPKVEEGIGVLLNVLITFDLDEIRAAGGPQQGRQFEFICDRAGINDDCAGDVRASVQMVALVSNAHGVQTASINGADAQVTEHKSIWSITSPSDKPLRADGRFAQFRVAIPADAKYLTLLTTSAGDGGFADHGVWSGARLEVQK